MTTLDRRALESYERWYLEPLEPVDWETGGEDAYWDGIDRRYEEEREGRLLGF